MTVEDHKVNLIAAIAETVDDDPGSNIVAIREIASEQLRPMIFVHRPHNAAMADGPGSESHGCSKVRLDLSECLPHPGNILGRRLQRGHLCNGIHGHAPDFSSREISVRTGSAKLLKHRHFFPSGRGRWLLRLADWRPGVDSEPVPCEQHPCHR